MEVPELSIVLKTIPSLPGCYKYYTADNELLYVGKAKDLKKRVNSYFLKTVDNFKTRRLVSLIHRIEWTITNNEHDAFLLENNLIKEYQPRFNIELKDDKTYPFIVIKNEHFPRVYFTRRWIKDGSEYLGPFTDIWRVRQLLDMVKQNLPLRTCSLPLTPEKIRKKKYKVCLEYHIGNCKGPCEGLQTEAEYNESIRQVRHIMKGSIQEVIKHLKAEMNELAVAMQFEKAQVIKSKIEALLHYESKSTVVNTGVEEADVTAMVSNDKAYFINYMNISGGAIIHTHTIEIAKKIDNEDEESILSIAVEKLRNTFKSTANEIIAPYPLFTTDNTIKITVPKAGSKKQLLELSLKNAQAWMRGTEKKDTLLLDKAAQEAGEYLLEEVQDALRLTCLPEHIECFDNSNFQGSSPVAAMVCFKKGLPSKKDYRRFHIKTVEGINDFASMSEIVYRRYKRLSDDNQSLPNLVIIDGGKGQLSAALESIEKLGLTGKMAIVGLAKREEALFYPGDSEPLMLPFDSPALNLIRRIRDEVHRFGITFHRNVRSNNTLKNGLEDIPGIGAKTATELLTAFRSIKNIKTLTERELTKVVGASKARLVWAYFNNTDNPEQEG
ncbi:MAG: excinuclease ABC subunit C [Chitinophagia bacterium]|nr:excinuclease ABC subunit C [Chitinophagia bacterium]